MRITKADILNVALSLLENRYYPSRDDMKRAAGRTLWKLIMDERVVLEEILTALEVDFSYEEELESKIDKALWKIFAEIVVFIDKERRRW